MSTNPTKARNEELVQFDQLPDDALVRQTVVEKLYDISPSTLWRWVGSRRLPPPEKVGPNSNRWRVGKLRTSIKTTEGV